MHSRILFSLMLITAICVSAAEDETGFAEAPSVKRDGDKVLIKFTAKASTDVEVTVLDEQGVVVRHLAAGVLGGKNPPPAPLKTGLEQSLEWDLKTDTGASAGDGPLRVRVRAGLKVRFDGFIGENSLHMSAPYGIATDAEGHVYLYSASTGNKGPDGTPYVVKYDREGKYVRTLCPMPADLPKEKAAKLGTLPVPGEHIYPVNKRGTWPVLGASPGSLYHRVSKDGVLTFFDWSNVRRLGPDGGPAGDVFAQNIWPKGKRPSRGDWRYKIHRTACIAVSPDGKHAYVAGLQDKKPGGRFPAGRIYRVALPGGCFEKFVDLEGGRGAGRMDFDKDGNLLVCSSGRITVVSPEGKEIGGFDVPSPSIVACNQKTGAVYVLSVSKPGYFQSQKALRKFTGWQDAKEEISLDLGKAGRQCVMALDASAEKPIVWVAIARTRGGNPFNPGAPAKLLRFEDNGSAFGKTSHAVRWTDKPMGVVTRLAVHPETDMVICRSEFSLAAGYEGLTGKRIKIPFEHSLDMAVGLDGNWYFQPGNMWAGRIQRYDKELKPVDVPGRNGSAKGATKNTVGFAYGRYGNGFGVAGITADAKGRIYTAQQINQHTVAGDCVVVFGPDGKAEDHSRMKNNDRIIKKHKHFSSALFGPIASVVGNIAVDWKGFIYLALRCYPMDHKPPKGFGSDPAYWACTGSVVKINPDGGALHSIGGKGSRPPRKERAIPPEWKGMKMMRRNAYPCGNQFCEGAVKAYPGIGSMSGGFGGGCRCRQPMFQLDGWGRLFIPNAITYSVQVVDNEGNEILKFGHYGNADSRGTGKDSLVKTPEIPLGWPEAVGASHKAIYVADVLNRRIVRLLKAYSDEKTVEIAPK